MEKFGIFDLLDALSAATSPPAAPSQSGNGASEPAPASDASAEIKPDANDAAFAAPSYGSPAVQNMEKAEEHTPENSVENAYSEFLARHEQAVKRIEKKR